MTGRIVGIGVGPGTPDLLTMRAVNMLRECDIVAAPRATDDSQSLALKIAQPHIRPNCEVRELHFPMTKNESALDTSWKNAARELIAFAAQGKTVAFLTLGDAMLYSTWGYVLREIQKQAPGIPVSTVPGITAMAACAAEVGTPLAEGTAPLIVWPGEPPQNLNCHGGNAVFMKASRHLQKIQSIASQNSTECVAVRNCCLPNQGITRNLAEWENDTQYFTTVLCLKKNKETLK